MRRILCLVVVLLILDVASFAQDVTPQPTVVPIVLQSNPNLGRVQPFVMSEIFARVGLSPWQDANLSGKDIRVGVLDRGFGNVETFSGLYGTEIIIPPDHDISSYQANSITHGIQVIETIYAIAPDVIFYACEYASLDSFIICVDWMINSDVQIINHSAGVPALPLDGSSAWARQVDRASDADILWVNSAGNFAQGFYRDVFTDNNSNSYHEYRGQAGIVEELVASPVNLPVNGVIMLSWEGQNGLPANFIDLDLEIINPATGQVIAASANPQYGQPTDEAIEYLRINMNEPFGIRVRDAMGMAAGTRFALFVEFARLPNGEAQQSIITPADSQNALTVGAIQGHTIAPYSSRGPLSNGAVKPDLVAPGELSLPFSGNFIGTSASSALVSGVAAIIWEANPDWHNDDVYTFLVNATQDDGDITGADNIYGKGRLVLPSELTDSIGTTTVSVLQSPTTVIRNGDWTPQYSTFEDVAMVLVPPGCFVMGSSTRRENETPPHQQCTDYAFWLDRYEVTNAVYGSSSEWWGEPNRPRVVVSWSEAKAHCEARGGRLPTELEWEFAAVGPDSLPYPWGDNFNPDYVVFGNTSNQQTAEVGSRPGGISWVGAEDMVGNVYEWVSTAYGLYPYSLAYEIEANTTTIQRVARGGSWIVGVANSNPTVRVTASPEMRNNTTGFRCARGFEGLVTAPTLPEVEIRSGVNLRAGPGTAYAVIGSATQGQRLLVFEQYPVGDDIWYMVRDLDGARKWVIDDYVTIIPEGAEIPIARSIPSAP